MFPPAAAVAILDSRTLSIQAARQYAQLAAARDAARTEAAPRSPRARLIPSFLRLREVR